MGFNKISWKGIIPMIVVLLFVIMMAVLLAIISVNDKDYKGNDSIRAIGYPKGIIQREGKYYQVIEMHDFLRDTVYMDTVPYYRRKPSTLEDYDPKWRKINLIE